MTNTLFIRVSNYQDSAAAAAAAAAGAVSGQVAETLSSRAVISSVIKTNCFGTCSVLDDDDDDDDDADEKTNPAASSSVSNSQTLEIQKKDDTHKAVLDLGETSTGINRLITRRGKAVKSKIEVEFEVLEQIVLRWDSNSATLRQQSLPGEDSPEEAAEYFSAVDEILRLIEDPTLIGNCGEIMERAESVLQIAMLRLEDEFRHILISSTIPLDACQLHESGRSFFCRVSVSLASNDGQIEDFEGSIDDDLESCCHERRVSLGQDLCVELIQSDLVVGLKEIADRMIRCGYEKECCQVYISVRRDVLRECLSILELERISMEEVQKIEWKHLDDKMKEWSQNIKIVIRVLLPGEKNICDQIFAGSNSIRDVCYREIAKGCMIQLLTFGKAISIARLSPETLFNILNMYEALKLVLPDLQALFSYDSSDFVYNEAKVMLEGLGEAAKCTFIEFESAVLNGSLMSPTQGGGIHPLTRYAMNYLRLLIDYSDTLDSLLESNVDDNDNGGGDEVTSLASRLQNLITSLESDLEEKSKLYEDEAMQNIFLMNNIHYVDQKVKDTDLGKLLGYHWVRKRRGQVRQYATGYLRASWSKVLSCLKDEGIGGRHWSSTNGSKMALKERFKNFNLGFEDIYKTQTAWKVTDPLLREELRIFISENILQAYRTFIGRFGSLLESGRFAGKYIKYSTDDLDNYLLDLFEGTPRVMNNR